VNLQQVYANSLIINSHPTSCAIEIHDTVGQLSKGSDPSYCSTDEMARLLKLCPTIFNLTPQPPSLQGKGEPENPSPKRGGVRSPSRFAHSIIHYLVKVVIKVLFASITLEVLIELLPKEFLAQLCHTDAQ